MTAAATPYVFSTYTYTGPVQSVSLRGKAPNGDTVTYYEDTLYPGNEYLLPDGHSAVEGWKALKLISKAGGQ